MNARFQIAIHILTLLNKSEGELLSSDYIAGSLNTNPALVRKEISNLRNHGFIESKEGKGGGYSLSKPAAKITLADIYQTVKTGAVLGTSKNEPNPDCPVGKQISGEINKLYMDVDLTILSKLATITLEKFGEGFN
ncbi:Rrf2 family transcriptional regulator [Mucilaginibacter mali]|uniref:Rrf2 family transcriptional regulator n=1 Tax=Mucilaginibacter mali TaxID=2740462 RepID=A0A7D4Q9X8_9SPHI|nr:Rrf2 family transcriptional regulator [Mucilaginibacter mali]QKJ29704.1 Rrf2 family transcriptional regulator [Mucilaginibacter mali]